MAMPADRSRHGSVGRGLENPLQTPTEHRSSIAVRTCGPWYSLRNWTSAEVYISIRAVCSQLDRIRDKTVARPRSNLIRLALQATAF